MTTTTLKLARRERSTTESAFTDNSYVLWEGPSAYDGTDIVAIASGITDPSQNAKTGDMVQVWIFSTAGKPNDVAKAGDDAGTCGACPFRPTSDDSEINCYLRLYQQTALWKRYNEGRMKRMTPEQLATHLETQRLNVRLGAYGDPAMIPLDVWRTVLSGARKHTSYTHQWDWASTDYADITMASVETLADKRRANDMGYRTYRATTDIDDIQDDEIQCPEQSQGRDKVDCNRCGLCSGNTNKAKNILIHAI